MLTGGTPWSLVPGLFPGLWSKVPSRGCYSMVSGPRSLPWSQVLWEGGTPWSCYWFCPKSCLPGQTSPEVQNWGISGPIKVTYVLQVLKKPCRGGDQRGTSGEDRGTPFSPLPLWTGERVFAMQRKICLLQRISCSVQSSENATTVSTSQVYT